MTHFVVDCSVTMSWCFKDEQTAEGDSILESLMQNERSALVPSLWQLEVINVLSVAERQKRISIARAILFLNLLSDLPIQVDEGKKDPQALLFLSRTYELSAYDTAYLALALSAQIPLATLDKKLKTAAKLAGIPLINSIALTE
jgi:predicted nucleic acid-binding protein